MEKIKIAKGKLRALDHELRSDILDLIGNSKMSVTKIFKSLGREQCVDSLQLSILREQGFVKDERHGKFINYSVNHKEVERVRGLIDELVGVV